MFFKDFTQNCDRKFKKPMGYFGFKSADQMKSALKDADTNSVARINKSPKYFDSAKIRSPKSMDFHLQKISTPRSLERRQKVKKDYYAENGIIVYLLKI